MVKRAEIVVKFDPHLRVLVSLDKLLKPVQALIQSPWRPDLLQVKGIGDTYGDLGNDSKRSNADHSSPEITRILVIFTQGYGLSKLRKLVPS